MRDLDNDTWEDNPRRKVCRAPACRCESPCDDYNDSGKRCARCYKGPDDCNCKRCAAGTCFADECDHCADCGEYRDDCTCNTCPDCGQYGGKFGGDCECKVEVDGDDK